MPGDKGERVNCVPGDKMPIAVTDPDRRHFDQDLSRLRLLEIDFLDSKWLPGCEKDSGSDFHLATLPPRTSHSPSNESNEIC